MATREQVSPPIEPAAKRQRQQGPQPAADEGDGLDGLLEWVEEDDDASKPAAPELPAASPAANNEEIDWEDI